MTTHTEKLREFFRSLRRRNQPRATCQRCGRTLSEWFVHPKGTAPGLFMWCPSYIGRCGWVSPWHDHDHFRETN